MATQKFLDQHGVQTLWTKVKGATVACAVTAGNSTYAASAGYAQKALTASYAATSGRAITAARAVTAARATYAASAGYATTASSATTAGYAVAAGDANTLDGLNSTAFATAGHTHTLPHTSIDWSSTNTNSSLCAIDVALSPLHSANRLAFAKPAGIKVEYSTDGGSTWTDYGLTDEQKINLVSGIGQSVCIGKKTSGITTNDKLRVTLDATACQVYTRAARMLLNVSTNGASGCSVKIEYSKKGSATSFTDFGTYGVGGWSGWNGIPITGVAFGGGDTQTSNWAVIRMTFSITGVGSSASNLTLIDIALHGETYWNYPSAMAKTNHLYTYDAAQNAAFPANVSAVNFVGTFVGKASEATTASNATYAASAGYAQSALTATNAVTASRATTAGWAVTAGRSKTAARATYAASAGYAVTATNAASAVTSTYAYTSTTASNATYAASAGYAQSALTATYAVTAAKATYSASAGYSTTAAQATTAGYAQKSLTSSYATTAAYAFNATTAAYASNANQLDGLDSTAFATAGHNHSGVYSPVGHTHSYTTPDQVNTTVNTAISNLINGATSTLDTLNELAAALGNDPNYSTTILTALNNKLDKSATATHAVTAGYALQALTASYAVTAGWAITAGRAVTAARAITAARASYAGTASRAVTATNAVTAANATYAASAGYSTTASRATYSASAGYAATAAGAVTAANTTTAEKLTTVSKTAWGQTFWTNGGVPTSISGNIIGNNFTIYDRTTNPYFMLTNNNLTGYIQILQTGEMCIGPTSTKSILVSQDGAVTANGIVTATQFFESSDETLKNFINDIEVDFEKLSKLPKKYFTWKDGDDNIHIGTSAQEVQNLYPELVSKNKDGKLTVDYAKLSIIALKAVDKLNERLEKVEQIIAKLNID